MVKPLLTTACPLRLIGHTRVVTLVSNTTQLTKYQDRATGNPLSTPYYPTNPITTIKTVP